MHREPMFIVVEFMGVKQTVSNICDLTHCMLTGYDSTYLKLNIKDYNKWVRKNRHVIQNCVEQTEHFVVIVTQEYKTYFCVPQCAVAMVRQKDWACNAHDDRCEKQKTNVL